MSIQQLQLNTKLQRALSDLFENSGATSPCLKLKKKGASIAIFAGAIRDAFIAQERPTNYAFPRDIDIGVGAISRNIFDSIMHSYDAVPNRYGGYKLPLDNSTLEFWRLEETVGLTKFGIECNLINVLRSFVLDCNAIAYDPFSRTCIDSGAYHAIKNSRIGFVRNAILHDEGFFASKALLLSFRLGFRPSAAVKKFVALHCTQESVQHEIQKSSSRNIESQILNYYVNNRFIDQYRWISQTKIPIVDIVCALQSIRISDKSMEGIRSCGIDVKDKQKEH
jgi:hypothetical protein